jgi:hypothetical protein
MMYTIVRWTGELLYGRTDFIEVVEARQARVEILQTPGYIYDLVPPSAAVLPKKMTTNVKTVFQLRLPNGTFSDFYALEPQAPGTRA